jgi:hypothetical protein
MTEPDNSTDHLNCCICLDTIGSLEYQRYWSCTAPHADYICRDCMLEMIRQSTPCPLCRARNTFEIISIKNISNFFVNNQIFDNDVIDIITRNQINNNIYNEIIPSIINNNNNNIIEINL